MVCHNCKKESKILRKDKLHPKFVCDSCYFGVGAPVSDEMAKSDKYTVGAENRIQRAKYD